MRILKRVQKAFYSHDFSHALYAGNAISARVSSSILGEGDGNHAVESVVDIHKVLVLPREPHPLTACAAVADQADIDTVHPLC